MFARSPQEFLPRFPDQGKAEGVGRSEQGMISLEGRGPVDVHTWRRCWLLAAGFDRADAEVLAAATSVDLHALLELVDRGCPPDLAARIMAPLPGEGRVP